MQTNTRTATVIARSATRDVAIALARRGGTKCRKNSPQVTVFSQSGEATCCERGREDLLSYTTTQILDCEDSGPHEKTARNFLRRLTCPSLRYTLLIRIPKYLLVLLRCLSIVTARNFLRRTTCPSLRYTLLIRTPQILARGGSPPLTKDAN